MSVRLSADEAWAVIEAAHTGIFTTLRRDGMPIALPVWFAAIDRTICLAAPSRTKKIRRLRRDPRASFLVESGERWAELEAVHLTGRVEFVDDPVMLERIDAELDRKYAPFRTDHGRMPERTQAHYAGRTFMRLIPDERILSWDNRRLQLKDA
ncbi:MAG TPA: pyridoxamine 5'-phosphate oxidase family protein [Acidimicrobiales bacterium]|jgi:PPOX class probable F420-dependent enzyme|nr:pyridoxamine 5'-phosphate oxidase family protein [Acidimicrobiales bacterium]